MTPPPASPHSRRTLAMLCILPWFLLLFQYLVIVPRYTRLYADHRVQATDRGRFLLEVGQVVSGHPALAALITLAAIVMSITWVYTADSVTVRPRGRQAILGFVYGLPTALFLLTWVGVAMLHRTLIEALER